MCVAGVQRESVQSFFILMRSVVSFLYPQMVTVVESVCVCVCGCGCGLNVEGVVATDKSLIMCLLSCFI